MNFDELDVPELIAFLLTLDDATLESGMVTMPLERMAGEAAIELLPKDAELLAKVRQLASRPGVANALRRYTRLTMEAFLAELGA